MSIWKTPISLENIKDRGKGTMIDFLEIEFFEIGDNYLKATMPVNEKTKQPIGILHGGASCVLAETIGSMAANYAVDITQNYCVGLSITTNHIQSVREGYVSGTACPIHLGRSTQVWNIDIKNDGQKLISSTRLTMAVLTRPLRNMSSTG
jgi:1,4-dihydroxy-2-naphthoyl-CoA hydrolase